MYMHWYLRGADQLAPTDGERLEEFRHRDGGAHLARYLYDTDQKK